MKRVDENLVALEENLEEWLKFESLLAEISAHFINMPADQIDGGIEDAQRRICELLDIDRSTLWQVPADNTDTILLTHYHQPPAIQTPPDRVDLREFWPWAAQKVINGETLTLSKLSDLPPDAARDRENFSHYGTKSVVAVPLSVGRREVVGLVTFTVLREERDWSERVIRGFHLIAEVFSNALARKIADRELRESEARLNMATNAAGAGLWIMDIDTERVWVSPSSGS